MQDRPIRTLSKGIKNMDIRLTATLAAAAASEEAYNQDGQVRTMKMLFDTILSPTGIGVIAGILTLGVVAGIVFKVLQNREEYDEYGNYVPPKRPYAKALGIGAVAGVAIAVVTSMLVPVNRLADGTVYNVKWDKDTYFVYVQEGWLEITPDKCSFPVTEADVPAEIVKYPTMNRVQEWKGMPDGIEQFESKDAYLAEHQGAV